MDLSRFTTPILRDLKENLNLTEDEEIVFDMLSKGKSRVQIAERLCSSVPYVAKQISRIKNKMKMIGFDWKK